jgi:NADH dehydrogenase FAD-containing subunit
VALISNKSKYWQISRVSYQIEQPRENNTRMLLTFIIVGAGATGVELAGAIAEISHKALAADFRHIAPKQTRILLIEAGPRILPAFPEALSRKAHRELAKMGVEVHVGLAVSDFPWNIFFIEERDLLSPQQDHPPDLASSYSQD